MINCPYCGKLTDPSLASCPHCGGPMRAKPPQPAPGAAVNAGQRCPNCRNPVQDGDIICVRCGTNLLTGQKIAAEQEQVAKPARNWRPIVLVGVLIIAATGLIGGLALYLSYDPVAEAVRLSQTNLFEAINKLQQYAERHPDKLQARLTLGKLHWQAQQFLKAAQDFDAVAEMPKAEKDTAWLSVAAAAKIPGPEGRDMQVAALRRVLTKEPGNPEALRLLALCNSGDQAARKEALDALAKNGGENPSDAVLAVIQALNGDYASAEKALKAALQANPNDGNAHAALGMVAGIQEKSGDEVMAYFEKALESGSQIDAFVRIRLGVAYMAQGNFEKALPLLRDAAAGKDPNPAAVFFNALCLQQSGLTSESMVEYDRIITAGGPYAADAALQLAGLYLEQQNSGKAEDTLRRANQIGGASARAYTLEGRIRLSEGDQGAAQQAFQNAIKTDPNYANAHLENGLVYIGRGIIAEGLRELSRYLELTGADTTGTRATEIEVLVEQLKQSTQNEAGNDPAQQGDAK